MAIDALFYLSLAAFPMRVQSEADLAAHDPWRPSSNNSTDATTVLPPGFHAETDDSGNLIIDVPSM